MIQPNRMLKIQLCITELCELTKQTKLEKLLFN